MKAKLFIIGSPSLDKISIKDNTYNTPGGAGLYTALGAISANTDVTLFSPKPDNIPTSLSIVEENMKWIGPHTPLEQLPQFHIRQSCSDTIYDKAFFGSESTLSPNDLPQDLSNYDMIHIVPLGDGNQQLTFIEACRSRGAKLISCGTAMPIIERNHDTIKRVMEASDFFFMNEEEFNFLQSLGVFTPSSGQFHFVTKGAKGVTIHQGSYSTRIPSPSVNIFDPTGAGDTFCGSTLAKLAGGYHPIMAAKFGTTIASHMVQFIGPSYFQSPLPNPEKETNNRVKINEKQLHRIATLISEVPDAKPFPFIDSTLPDENDPITLDYFFVTTLQQFSFWSHFNNHYHFPLIDTIAGKELKGAFYLFQAYTKRIQSDPDFFSPARQANQTYDDMISLFQSDEGKNVMPALQLHLDIAQDYGKSMLELGWTPTSIIQTAQNSDYPLKTFLKMLDHVGGYREDPLRKKSALLALILEQRPEGLFQFGTNESLPPVVDYHCMRGSLRLGLIDILDQELEQKIINRQLVSEKDEWDIRYEIYKAVDKLPDLAGRTMGAVDWFFFMSRKRCPEMTEPDCISCPAEKVCIQRKDYFQPVIRTSFY